MPDVMMDPVETAGQPEPQMDAEQTETIAPQEAYTITVAGHETEVTLDELRNGYMRQADYSRKTQDLSNQRTELRNAIEIDEAFRRDPAAATMALAEFYGFNPSPGQQPQQQQNGYDEWDDNPPAVDPSAGRIADLERQIKALATNQSEQYLDREAAALVERYPGIDPVEVKRHAIANKLPNLEVAARDLLYDDRNEAWQALQAKKEAERSVIEAKKQAGVVNPGSGPANGSVGTPPGDHMNKSFAELFAETARENNIDLSLGLPD